ncbi:hypothetical protein CSA37_01240 [Candidatus Fermentibacteria bacterium]|nr:MAG: hypothetical protein CSA37_13490 [Candidatus Fermentibacteria bacterium]PIE51912.1 MAG: hypothetical protein CSA37_09025 [Candidatus Fermentibacteria bacterium]PIE53474.1 MAG: hypothetical protein CSA37_01240 [Candidatus Fermentibacteria bacterium]
MRLVILLLSAAALNYAAIITVPEDYSQIQSAIDAAAAGDTVLVSPGTYNENINFSGKSVVVASTDGPETTIIDAQGSGSVVRFTSSETRDAVLNGFTLQNGTGTLISPYYYGGGINCTGSSPTITNNIIRQNTGFHGGGILCYLGGNPLIEFNIVENNTAEHFGAGIYISSSSAEIRANVIRNNSCSTGAGITSAYNSPCTAENNLLYGNEAGKGGAIAGIIGGTITADNCTVANNTGTTSSGGLYGYNSNITVTNSIFWGNTAPAGAQCNLYNGTGTFTWSDFQGGETAVLLEGSATLSWGDGMIDEDPLFENGGLSAYHLGTGSPCIDGGNPSASCNDTEAPANPGNPLWPALGTLICDMGVYGGNIFGGWVEVADFTEEVSEHVVAVDAIENPVEGFAYLNCSFPENSQASLKLYNASGRLVGSEPVYAPGTVILSTSELPSGIHFVKLETTAGFSTARLMVLN